MIKYRIENDISEIDFSIDDTSNALVMNTDKGAIEIPYHYAIKLLTVLKQELVNSEETNRKRKAGKFKSWLI